MKVRLQQKIVVPKGDMYSRTNDYAKIKRALDAMELGKSYVVTVEEKRPTRTGSQNNLLWKMYDEILSVGGESMRGWTKDDLHTFFLIDHFGSETIQMFGRKKLVPLRRSSRLNKQDFSDFVLHIVDFMAAQGVRLAMPENL